MAASDQSRPPVAAANAIGMPKLKATPSTACGIETKRLAYGYASVMASAANDSRIVGGLVVSTRPNASSASMAPNVSAALTDSAPLVTGRCAVRLTCLSNSRSATSLMQQPALRIRIVPSVNTASRCQPGKPSQAIHSAASVGHSSSSQPAGRFQRIRSR